MAAAQLRFTADAALAGASTAQTWECPHAGGRSPDMIRGASLSLLPWLTALHGCSRPPDETHGAIRRDPDSRPFVHAPSASARSGTESPPANDVPATVPSDEKAQVQVGAGVSAEDPVDASLIELISSPERYRDRWVRVIGFVVLEFEGNAVYLHEEDFVHGITRNALWLRMESSGARPPTRSGYAIVEGRFASDEHGHMDLFSGALTKIGRIGPLPARLGAP
jgi:hypothetical protein